MGFCLTGKAPCFESVTVLCCSLSRSQTTWMCNPYAEMVFLPQKLRAMLVWKSLVPGEGCFQPQVQWFSWKWRMVQLESEIASWTAWTSHLLLLSHQVMSDSLRPHGLQHTRLPCPSATPGAYTNSTPSSQWCHQTISSSVIPFSSLQFFPASGSFPMSQFFALGGQSIGVSASASDFPVNLQLQSKGLSGVFSNTTVQKHQFFDNQLFFIVQLSHTYVTAGKTIALTIWTLPGNAMSLLHKSHIMNEGRNFQKLERQGKKILPRSFRKELILMSAP